MPLLVAFLLFQRDEEGYMPLLVVFLLFRCNEKGHPLLIVLFTFQHGKEGHAPFPLCLCFTSDMATRGLPLVIIIYM